MQQLIEENFKRRSPAEAFARAKINLVDKDIEERGIKGFQINRLGAIFMDDTTTFLSPLPILLFCCVGQYSSFPLFLFISLPIVPAFHSSTRLISRLPIPVIK